MSYTPYLTNKSTGKVEMDFIPFPAESVAAGCSGYGITKKHANETQTANGVTKTNKEIAWDFIKYIISEEGQNLGGGNGFIQPILKSLEENGTWKQAIDPSLNHDAWYAGKELRQTMYNDFDAVMRKSLRIQMSNFLYCMADVEFGASDKRDETISDYMKKLQAVKDGAVS